MAKEGLGLEITELRLGLPGAVVGKNEKKKRERDQGSGDEEKISSPMKSQVVGWPPVCSYRRRNSLGEKDVAEISKMYVKVSMDGAPFLRKIDLNMHKGYSDLAEALEKLFGFFGIGEALKGGDSYEYAPIYEDKDGDWMLAGDVPWEMFIETCKRLRIMKKLDAKGFGLQTKNIKASLRNRINNEDQ